MKMPAFLLIALISSCPAFAQSSCQSASQPPQQQSQPEKNDDSAPDTMKKSEKEKPKTKKIYTEEDLSRMHDGGNGISVVGNPTPAPSGAGAAPKGASNTGNSRNAARKAPSGVVPMSGQDEAYWRGKAKPLLDEIAATGLEIEKTKADIKKYGPEGFDATSGFKDNVIYIDNRNTRLEELQKHKADLEKKLDQLQEDGRKAGAPPEWFR